jgi:hypothetical protein
MLSETHGADVLTCVVIQIYNSDGRGLLTAICINQSSTRHILFLISQEYQQMHIIKTQTRQIIYVQRNTEAHSNIHFFRGKQ